MRAEDAIDQLLPLQRVLALEAARDDERLDVAAISANRPTVLSALDRMTVGAVGIAEVKDRSAGLAEGGRYPCGRDGVSVAVRHVRAGAPGGLLGERRGVDPRGANERSHV